MGKQVQDGQSSISPVARQRISFRAASLLLVAALSLFLFISVFSANFSLGNRFAVARFGLDNGSVAHAGSGGGDVVDVETGVDGDTGFDLAKSVAGCAENRAQRHGCLMDGRLYTYSEGGPWVALFKPAQQPAMQAHGSNLLILPSGELLCTWFSGMEGEDEVAIVLARLPKGSTQWSDPMLVSVTKGRAAQNPVLFHDAENDVVFLYHTSQVAYRGQGTAQVVELRSSDSGITWSSPSVLLKENGAFIRNQVVLLPQNRWLMPMYYTSDGYGHFETHYSAAKVSRDQGRTWKEYSMSSKGQWLVEPTVVKGRRGLIAFFRNRHADWIFTSVSTDEGRIWSLPRKTALPNNNSGIQALFLKSGSLALVFNNRSGAKRYPLSIALSEDEGVTWTYVRDIEPGDASELPPDGEYSDPSIVQSSDGFIHVSYTYLRQSIKYVCVTEAWIRRGGTSGDYRPVMLSTSST